MLVALPDDPALALFDLRGQPRHVEMMQGLQPKLHIDARAHCVGRADDEAHLAGIEVVEQALLGLGFLEVLHVGDLGRRHAKADEFSPDPAIGREATRGLDRDRAKIGEDELAGAGPLEGFPSLRR